MFSIERLPFEAGVTCWLVGLFTSMVLSFYHCGTWDTGPFQEDSFDGASNYEAMNFNREAPEK